MLDENLPTFRFRPSGDNPTNTTLHFTHRGSDPTPTHLILRPDPADPASRNKYAAALADPSFPSIIHAEVLVEPEWQRPPASTAEARSSTAAPAIATPLTPDTVNLRLYNPDQTVAVRRKESGWSKTETWEFQMPERSFRVPSASRLDREAAASTTPAEDDSVPKVLFRWKRDGKLSRDMTCYLVGRVFEGKKSKEPDITIALFKQGKAEDTLTVYEPNMQRVDIEDRKGLEFVLLLSAEVVRSLYLSPKGDVFNVSGTGSPGAAGKRRSNSRPMTMPAAAAAAVASPHGAYMSGGASISTANLPNARPHHPPAPVSPLTPPPSSLVEDQRRKAAERDRRDAEEQERIRKMLQKEDEKERRRREAEVEKETERLRKMYGVEGQSSPPPTVASGALPPRRSSAGAAAGRPPLPPRPHGGSPQQLHVPFFGGGHAAPPRPVSAGPLGSPAQQQYYQQQQQQQQGGSSQGPRKRIEGMVSALTPYASSAVATVTGVLQHDKKKLQKKRSGHF